MRILLDIVNYFCLFYFFCMIITYLRINAGLYKQERGHVTTKDLTSFITAIVFAPVSLYYIIITDIKMLRNKRYDAFKPIFRFEPFFLSKRHNNLS